MSITIKKHGWYEMTYELVTCKTCGVKFITSRRNKVYCTPKCRGGKMTQVVCP